MTRASLGMIRQLARAGDTARAWQLFVDGGFASGPGDADTLTLKGRLFKDRALKSLGEERSTLLEAARQAYLAAATMAPATYPLINAATIALLDGDRSRAADTARQVLGMLDSGAHEPETVYWLGATRAEACLLLGRNLDARAALSEAMRQAPRAWEDHASTLRHFRLIHEILGEADDWLESFRPPQSLHFSGIIHVAPDRAGSDAIADALEKLRPGFAYGALSAGADIMVAEFLLARGAELHIALPATVEAFRRDSVSRFGAEWDARFDAVIKSADSVEELGGLERVSQSGVYVSDEMAMGMAIRQAAMLETTATALRMGEGARAMGSTLDAAWYRRSLPIHRVPLDRTDVGNDSILPVFAREAVVALSGAPKSIALKAAATRIDERGGWTIVRIPDPHAAALAALREAETGTAVGIAYSAFDPDDDRHVHIETATLIAGSGIPGRVLVSRSVMLALSLHAPGLLCENFGTIASSQGDIALGMVVPA